MNSINSFGTLIVFPYTAPCEEETNMAVENEMTRKIDLIRCQRNPLFCIPSFVNIRHPSAMPQTVFDPMLKNAQPRDKIVSGTCKFIFSPHFSGKNGASHLPRGRGVGAIQ